MESLKMSDISVWGSDGERALEQGLATVFKGEHLKCMKHAREDISRKLTSLNVPEDRGYIDVYLWCGIWGEEDTRAGR
jgi:hypothetical protein